MGGPAGLLRELQLCHYFKAGSSKVRTEWRWAPSAPNRAHKVRQAGQLQLWGQDLQGQEWLDQESPNSSFQVGCGGPQVVGQGR